MSMSLLVKFKENRNEPFQGKYVFCILDATAAMSSNVEYTCGRLTKTHRDDEGKATSVDFYNSTLEFKVHLGDGIVSSLLTEFIENSADIEQDGNNVAPKSGEVAPINGDVDANRRDVEGRGTNEGRSKLKCELTAFSSLAPKIRDLLGGMPLITAMDGLYECQEI
jgi:hypothetical protein